MSSSTSTSDKRRRRPADERSNRRFLLALLGLYLSSILLNVIVDPFDIFGGEVACFAAHKNDMEFNRATIIHQADRADPDLLVLGTSRVAVFHAEMLTELTGEPSHVLSVPAGDIYELRRHFEHYSARKSLRRVLIGLDYYVFNPQRDPYVGFDEARLQGKAPPWKDYALVATHHKALFQSLSVLRACVAETLSADTTAQEPAEAPPTELSLDQALRFARRWDFYASSSLDDFEALDKELAHLRAIVALAQARGVELHLFINPFHHKHWHMIHAVGRGASFAQWKRALVEIGPLWDFSGSNSVTRDDSNFTDSSHFRSPVAEWIVRRTLDLDQTGVPPDFGVWIEPGNVEARLESESDKLDPAIVEELVDLLEQQ